MLWESPPIPNERYEIRVRIRCTCRSSDFFYYSSKTDLWGRSLKVTAPCLNKPAVALAPRSNNASCQPTVETMPTVALNTPLSQYHAWLGAIHLVQRVKDKDTDTVYIEMNGGR